METHYFFEEKFYTLNYLSEKFGIDLSEKLTSQSFCFLGKNKQFKFSFVGLVILGNHLMIFFPKYYQKTHFNSLRKNLEFAQLIKVLQKANYELTETIESTVDDEFINQGKLGIFFDLLSNYILSGWYLPLFTLVTNDYNHKVNWAKTIEKYYPIITDREVIFSDVHSSTSTNEATDLIAKLHKTALSEAYEKIGYLIHPDLIIEDTNLLDLEQYSTEYLLMVLNRRLSETYKDEDIQVLILLISYVSEKDHNKDPQEISVYGTNSFYHIWELACSKVFGNEKALRYYFNYPIWSFQGSKYNAGGNLIPDLLFEKNDYFFLLDAKYYIPKYSKGHIENEPKTDSISKQIIYQLTLEKSNIEKKIYNGFLFPEPSPILGALPIEIYEFNKTDYTTISPMEDYKIFINYISAGSLFLSYLQNVRIESTI